MTDDKWIIQVYHSRSEKVWRQWTIGCDYPHATSLDRHLEYLRIRPELVVATDYCSLRFRNIGTGETIPFEVFGW